VPCSSRVGVQTLKMFWIDMRRSTAEVLFSAWRRESSREIW